jgi:hypothetical protein
MKIWREVTGVPNGERQISMEEGNKDAPGGIRREGRRARLLVRMAGEFISRGRREMCADEEA